MSTYRLKDFVDPIAITVQDPANSGFERFVGLEHYDSNELVIKRFSGVELLTTNAKAFQKNDLLIARRNVYLRRAGVVYFDGITSGDSIVLRVKEDCEKQTGISRELAQRVLPLVLNTDRFWIYANKHADGMNSKRISKDTLLDYEFNLPSIEEQKVLAEKLWAAYKVKESYRQLLSTTDEMLKAKFQEMFGDGKYSVRLDSVCELFVDGDWIESKDQSTEGIRLVQTGNVGEGVYIDKADKAKFINEETFRRLNCTEIFSGDILISRLPDPIGRACVLPKNLGRTITAVDCTIIRLKKEKMLQSFFIANTLTPSYTKQIYSFILGTTRMRISRNNLASIQIACPPIEEQKRFDEIYIQAEATKASLRASIEAIDRVIRSFINQ